LVARAASTKAQAGVKLDISDEIHTNVNADNEQKRYINFWVGVKKSIQLKKDLKCEIDKSLLKRFKKFEV
jgi:hypothetical protein